MNPLLRKLALLTTLACLTGAAWAQDDEPADSAPEAKEVSDAAAARRARIAARRARRRLAQQEAAAKAAKEQLAAAAEAEAAPSPQAEVPSAEAPSVVPPSGQPVDSGVDGSGALDAEPALAAVHDQQPAAATHGSPAGENTEHAGAHDDGHEAKHGEPAEGHGEHAAFSTGTFALQLLNFGALLFILIYFGGRKMNQALRARHEHLKSDIGEASRVRDEAKRKFEEQERRVADLEKEIAALRTSMRQDAEREHARLIENAQERAKRIQEEMRFQMDQQVKQAEAQLRAEVASASIKLAEELVKKSVGTEDERRLAKEFVAGFEGPSKEVR